MVRTMEIHLDGMKQTFPDWERARAESERAGACNRPPARLFCKSSNYSSDQLPGARAIGFGRSELHETLGVTTSLTAVDVEEACTESPL
jgi:hypothetical protein